MYENRPLRLPNYDYTQAGAYFVTVCTHERKCILGSVSSENVSLSSEGEIVREVWKKLPQHFTCIRLDEFIIMPNHIHGILWIQNNPTSRVGAQHAAHLQPTNHSKEPKANSLGAIIRSFKSAATRRINQLHHSPGAKFWQRSFYDHVIRDEVDLYNHRRYILENPLKWELDEYHA
jgi:REP element-mobilizing transposase RayT